MIKFPPKKILVACDLSAPSRLAWKHAAALATACGAELEILYVEPWRSGSELLPMAGLTPGMIRPLRAKLRELAGEGPRITIAEGDAAQAVLKRAAAGRADLIVVGTHGRKGLKRIIIGSTAEAVVRGAQTPVLVARGPVRPVVSILAPVNFTPYSDYGFSYAAGAGAVLDARVTALHVTGDPVWDGNPRYRLSTLIRKLPAKILSRCRPEAKEAVGEPVAGIVRAAKGYDWLLLVAHGKSVIGDALRGTTVERVMRRASIPVLSIPLPKRGEFVLQAAESAKR